MGTVIIHAGRPKTGTTSLQGWLTRNRGELARRGIQLLAPSEPVGRADHPDTLLEPLIQGVSCNASRLALAYLGLGRPRELIDRLTTELDRHASRLGTVLVTGEGLAEIVAEPDRALFGALEALAARHDVRLAYYVRPQHTAIEAEWRESLFRDRSRPSEFVASRARALDYERTHTRIRELAPRVGLRVRPLRRDLLTGGEIVADFVREILEIADWEVGEHGTANEGLPLGLVNLVRRTMPHRHELQVSEKRAIRILRAEAVRWDEPAPDILERSRMLLLHYAHERYEPGNRVLVRQCAWPTEHFVPAPDPTLNATGDLAELDELWCPTIGPRERSLVAGLRAQLDPPADRGDTTTG